MAPRLIGYSVQMLGPDEIADCEGDAVALYRMAGHEPDEAVSVAALCRFENARMSMRAALFSPDGSERVEASAKFDAEDQRAPRLLAHDLLSRATPGITPHFRPKTG